MLWGSAVTFLAILAVRVSSRAGLPSLLLYLLMGVALGEAGLGIGFEDAELAHALGFAALVVILAEGGLTTPWRDIRPSLRLGLSLATVGVAVSVVLVALGAHYLLGLRWETAVLLGAVTSPTDAAAVFSVLRVVPLPKRLTGALEAESGLNDAPTVVLVTLISTGALADHGVLDNVGLVVYELVAGLAVGLAVGFAGAWVMRRAALPSSGLYPLAVMALCFLAYGSAAVRARVRVRRGVRRRAGPRQRRAPAPRGHPVLRRGPGLAGPDRAVRDARAAALAGPDRPGDHRLRRRGRPGAHPGRATDLGPGQRDRPADADSRAGLHLLGGAARRRTDRAGDHPARRGGRDSERLFDIVFVLVVVYTLVTGPTLPVVAKCLRVARRSEPRGLDIEAAPLERVAADLLQVTISPVSKMHGVEVGELRLPPGSSVSMIVRDGETLVPERRTVLKHGDDLLVVTPRRLREQTEERLRQVSARGRLAQWLGLTRLRSLHRRAADHGVILDDH